ncbi:uncharacterized protein LOC134836638 [Culicoides brevitarsis]|uniref:uncharacterized protein LOC134836638 n=1 Tax=Culicoides brevitarsis TaxID=469753 RepID=UPI00307B12D4
MENINTSSPSPMKKGTKRPASLSPPDVKIDMVQSFFDKFPHTFEDLDAKNFDVKNFLKEIRRASKELFEVNFNKKTCSDFKKQLFFDDLRHDVEMNLEPGEEIIDFCCCHEHYESSNASSNTADAYSSSITAIG